MIVTFRIQVLVVFFFLMGSGSGLSQEARLSNIVVTNTRENLEVYLNVEGAFTEKMKTAVLSGVQTTFSFIITLYKVRDLWFDKKMADITITHTLKYHNLKKEFIIQRSWEDNKPRVAESFEDARRLMSEINGIKVISLNELSKGREYQIQSKAELSRMTLPLYLHYVLFFVSLWDFETDWYTINFTY